jgi:hopanoid biosynthesis associated RND transporter like protein HpnN
LRELPFLTSRALLFLSEQDLTQLVAAVEEAHPFLLSLSSPEGLAALLSDFEGNVAGSGQEKFISMLPFLGDIFHELRRAVETRGRADYHSPWGGLLFGDTSPELAERTQGGMEDTSFYHTTGNGTVHLLLLRFVKRDAETIELLRRTVEKAERAYPGLEVGITGEPLLEHDEMVSSETDSQQSGTLSMILVAILFAFAFRQLARPFTILGSFTLGAGWTLGFTTLAIGHLNLLTISFFTILVGSGMDFGIHILLRYEEEFLKQGGDSGKAMDEALVGTGKDIAVSAFSTAVAFWAVGMSDFKGVSELGIIAGFGILLCLVATVLPLPAALLLLDRKRLPSQGPAVALGSRILAARAEEAVLRKAPWTLLLVLVLLLLAAPRIASVGFDYNLLRLQDPRLESVQTELRLIQEGGNTVLFAVALADNIEHARELKARFEALPAVSHVDTVSDLFPEVTPGKLAALRRLRELVADVHIPNPDDASSGAVGSKELRRLGDGFTELERFFQAQREGLLHHESEQVRSSTAKFEGEMDSLFKELAGLGPGPIEDGLTTFQHNFFRDLDDMVEFLRQQDPDPRMSLEDLPGNLRLRSIGRTGKLVLRIYPQQNIWEREALDKFVAQVRATDASAIGAPIMIWHHTNMLRGAFEQAGLYAMVAITIIMFLYFRSVTWTLLAMLPLVLGTLFMLYTMAWAGISFNLANFMGLPLLLGIGMDYSIHVLHRAQEEQRVNMFDHSTGPATILSAFTTVAGFGTLALGGHRGVASLGFILATGALGIMLSALFVLPAILRVWSPFPPPAEASAEGVESASAQGGNQTELSA